MSILKGDKNDFNSPLLYDGAMISIRPLVERGAIHMILDTRENIDRVLIAPGHFTHEQIYGN